MNTAFQLSAFRSPRYPWHERLSRAVLSFGLAPSQDTPWLVAQKRLEGIKEAEKARRLTLDEVVLYARRYDYDSTRVLRASCG